MMSAKITIGSAHLSSRWHQNCDLIPSVDLRQFLSKLRKQIQWTCTVIGLYYFVYGLHIAWEDIMTIISNDDVKTASTNVIERHLVEP